jgi:hypothetical protein
MFSPHWVINGQRTSSQFDAWRYAYSLGPEVKPHFYFYEEQYDAMDWTTEPTETWDQLCYDRCMALRQRYKKLSLFYSAGRDSHHILRCFYHFKIPLDEIILIDYATNPDRRHQLINYIYPQVTNFIRQYPNTQVKTVDVLPDRFNEYYKDDWLEGQASAMAHGLFQPSDFKYYIKSILHADEPSHGLILGVDKPRIVLEDGKYYSTVIDKTMENFMSDIPNLEYFYYAPDMPKIHVKQSWMVLNHIERNYGKLIYTPDQLDPLINSALGAPVSSFTISSPNDTVKNTNTITHEFLIEYCGNAHSEYYDDFCIGSGRGSAWNVELSIQNGKSKHKNAGRETIHQKVLKTALDEKWKGAFNFKDAMDHLKNEYSRVFNSGDPYLGTLGVYSKKYYMKDST